MSARDRQIEMERFSAMFDAAESEEALIESLGSPTKQAIAIARAYEPSDPAQDEATAAPVSAAPAAEAEGATPARAENAAEASAEMPEVQAFSPAEGESSGEKPQNFEAAEENSADSTGIASASGDEAAPGDAQAASNAPEQSSAADGRIFDSDSALSPAEAEQLAAAEARGAEPASQMPESVLESAPAFENEPSPEVSAPGGRGKRRAKPGVLIIYIILALIIGLPIAVVLIAVGVPFILLGGGAIALLVWALLALIPILSMVSDILLVCGAGLIIAAAAILLVWLGLWISLSLGGAWIGGVIFRLGSRLCFKKEEN